MAMVKVTVTSEIDQPNALVNGMRNTLQAYTAPSAICMTTPAAAITQRFCRRVARSIDVYPIRRVHSRIAAIVVALAVAGASCRSAAPVDAQPPIVQPGAPGQPSHVIAAGAGQRSLAGAVHRRRHQVHAGHDRPPRAGGGDGGARAVAHRVRRCPEAGAADRRVAEGRNEDDARVAAGPRPADPGSPGASHDGRDADARHADAGRDGAPRRTPPAPRSTACSSKA